MNEETLLIIIIVILALVLVGAGLGGALERYTHLVTWFQGVHWKTLNIVLALIFSLINFGLIAFLAVIVRRYQKLVWKVSETTKKEKMILPKEEIRETLNNIRELANSKNPSDWSIAILQADVLFSDVLKNLGYEGPTMADQLKIVDPTRLPSLENIWTAHRLRNAIAHDPTEPHTQETILHALDSFKQGLAELGMMEKEI